MKTTVTCQVCQRELKQITRTHLKAHNLTLERYRELYPGAEIVSEARRARMSEDAKAINARRDYSGIGEKISITKRQRFAAGELKIWCEGLTKETSDALANAAKRIAETRRRKFETGELTHWALGKPLSAETRQRISEKLKGRQLTPEQRERWKRAMEDYWNSDRFVPPMRNRAHNEETRKKISEALRQNNRWRRACEENIQRVAARDNLEVLSFEGHYVHLRCNRCGMTFSFTKQMFNASSTRLANYCPTCFPRNTGTSNLEKEVFAFVQSIYPGQVIPNDRAALDGREIDILIPERHLGIEVTGLFWHAEGQNPDRNHLLHKTQLASARGIRLITIFEDEWRLRQDIVKSRLANLLGAPGTRVPARRCHVRVITSREKGEFLEQNHLQGNDAAPVCLGLFHDDKLVSVMTFKKTSVAKGGRGDGWELSRFCSRLNHHVVGGASKLLRHFIRYHAGETRKIISYADRRWSDGDLYRALGFTLAGTSKPNYWYTVDYRTRKHRAAFMKHTLKTKLADFNHEETEWQNMRRAGYDRIWDCGNLVWVLEA